MVFALLLASNEVFKYCLAAFLLFNCYGRGTFAPLVLFKGLVNAELFKSIEELTVYYNGSPML